MLGHAQSDPIEKEFGRYRQMSGACFYVSVRQILNSAKSIRLHALSRFSKISVSEFKKIFEETNVEKSLALTAEANEFVKELNCDEIKLEVANHEDNNLVFFISGYIAHSLLKCFSRCSSCRRH